MVEIGQGSPARKGGWRSHGRRSFGAGERRGCVHSQGPAAQASACTHPRPTRLAAESQRGAVLVCEGPASTMGLRFAARDREACECRGALDRETRAGHRGRPGTPAGSQTRFVCDQTRRLDLATGWCLSSRVTSTMGHSRNTVCTRREREALYTTLGRIFSPRASLLCSASATNRQRNARPSVTHRQRRDSIGT